MESVLDAIVDYYSHLKESMTWRDCAVCVAIGGSTWCLYKILVKPFLSPLRQVPGPPYKPIVGNMYDALRSEAMTSTIMWMTQYKSRVVRYYYLYGQGRVLVADPDLVKYISVTNSKNYVRFPTSGNIFGSLARKFVVFLKGDEHHALRQVLNPAFSIHTIESNVNNICDINIKGGPPSANLHDTLDLICECGFDHRLHAVESPETAGVHSFRRILQGTRLRLTKMLPFGLCRPRRTKRTRKYLYQPSRT